MSQSVVAGDSVTFSVSASSGGTALAYQWQRSTDGEGVVWSNVDGAAFASYTVGAVTAAMNGWQWRVVVSAGSASTTSSATTLTVTVPVPASIAIQPADQTLIVGAMATFSITASGTSLVFEWQSSGDGGTHWASVAGATNHSYAFVPTLASSGQLFRAVVTASTGPSVTSNAARLTVNPVPAIPVITVQPAPTLNVVAGQAASMSVVAAGGPTPTYQWQLSTDGGGTFNDIVGATSSAYVTPVTTASDNGKRFRVHVLNSQGGVFSNSLTLTVTAASPPGFASAPTDQLANYPDNDIGAARTATFRATASGTPTPSYQWQVSTDGGATFVDVVGATSAAYTTPAVTLADNGRKFRLVATNLAGSATSAVAQLFVNNLGIGSRTNGLAVRPNGDVVAAAFSCTGISCGGVGDFTGVRALTAAGAIITLAGNTSGLNDVDGVGASATLRMPWGLALDTNGNAYVSDGGNRIRKVTPSRVVTTLAGSDGSGFVNDTGSRASFDQPRGVAIDTLGNVYVADSNNAAIRKITPFGDVTTLAGGAVRGSVDGTGSAAQFLSPYGLAFDIASGTLLVTDSGACTLRRVTLTGAVTTLIGPGCGSRIDGNLATARLSAPEFLATDTAGNIFLVDQFAVRKVSTAGVVGTLGSSLFAPHGIATDAAGNAYVIDGAQVNFQGTVGTISALSFKIRRFAPDGSSTTLP